MKNNFTKKNILAGFTSAAMALTLSATIFSACGDSGTSSDDNGDDSPAISSANEANPESTDSGKNSSASKDPQSPDAASSSSINSSQSETLTDCSGKILKANTELSIDGRKVIVQFPDGYKGDKPTALLVNYHPIGGSADNWSTGSLIAKVAKDDGAIVAFMDGEQSPSAGQAWNVGPCCTDADDVSYTRNFIKEITEKACIDTKRIYAAGFSMGGGFSNYAGCKLADVFAAAAPSAFDLSQEFVDNCKPSRPFPILNLRGDQDNIVCFDGCESNYVTGKPITFLGAHNNFKAWAKINGCEGDPTPNTPTDDCQMYENCNGDVKVGLCVEPYGGHTEGDPNIAWRFLKQFSMP